MGGDIFVKFDGHVELSDRLQGLVQLNLAAIDVETLLLQRLRDIARGNRSKQLIVLPERRWKETDRPSNCLESASASCFSLAERRTDAAFI